MYKTMIARLLVGILVAVPLMLGLQAQSVSASSALPLAPPTLEVSSEYGAATLEWDWPANASKFNVYRDGVYVDTVRVRMYTDTAAPGVYTYYVVAVDHTDTTFSDRSNKVVADTTTLSSPTIIHATRDGGFNAVKWSQQADLKGVNVYRNDRYIGSVDFPDNVFNDDGGRAGATYYLIGYDHNGNFSERSTTELVGGRSIGPVTAAIDQQGTVTLRWQTTPGHTYRVYRAVRGSDATQHGTRLSASRATAIADRDAKYGGFYGIEMVDNNGTVVDTKTRIRVDYDAMIEAYVVAKQATIRPGTNVPPPPSGYDPYDPTYGPTSEGPGRDVVDLLQAIADFIDDLIDDAGDYIDDNFGPGTTVEEVVDSHLDDLAAEGFEPVEGADHLETPDGDRVTITTSGNTTSITHYRPSHWDSDLPASVTVTNVTQNPDGSVTREDDFLDYQYSMEGEFIAIEVNGEVVPPPRPSPSPGADPGGPGCTSGCRPDPPTHNPQTHTPGGQEIPGHY